MIGLARALDISKWALFTNQLAINIVGHNIANVNTDGYSRQNLNLEAVVPMDYFPGQLGGGVKAKAIKRSYDRFLGLQMTNELQPLGYWEAKSDFFEQIEDIFNEANGNRLNDAMNDFWDAWQQVADDPTNTAARVTLLSHAQTLSITFNHTYENLFQLRKDTNSQVRYGVSEINRLSDEIANLNKQIARAELASQNANDLRDQRDLRLQDLAKWVDIQYFENDIGEINVFTSGGQTLVQSVYATHLDVTEDATNHGFYRVTWNGENGVPTDITDSLSQGKLKGYLEMRDTEIPDVMEELDRVAAGIVNEVNKRHYFGYGLNGTTNVNFFSPLTATVSSDYENDGDGQITGEIYDPTILSRDDYRIDFLTGTTYQITDEATGDIIGFQIRAGSNDQIVFDDGGGDTTITLTEGAYTADQLAQEIESRLEANSSAGQDYTVTWDSENQHFLITNNEGNANPLILRWSAAGSTAAGTLGFSTAADDILATGQTATSDNAADHTFQYTSGDDVYLGGVRFTISDGSGGGPSAGDRFTISVTKDTSINIAVNPEILQDNNKIATSATIEGLPGDNQTALSLASLQHAAVMNQGKSTIDAYYNGLVGSIGVNTKAAVNTEKHYQSVKEQLETRREAVSGVSLDEEMINLIKYQQAFSANGKMISAIDEMMKELMDLL